MFTDHWPLTTFPMRYLLYLGYCLLVLVAAFFLAEGVVRLLGNRPYENKALRFSSVEPGGRLYQRHPTLGFAHFPGRYTLTLPSGFKFQVTHGNDGLRITHPPGNKPAAADPKQIWIFGCSFTYGLCLNDPETYPWLLQERFPDFLVVNFGVGGYGTIQSLIQLKEALAAGRKPPAVLIIAYVNLHDMRNCGFRSWRKGLIPHLELGETLFPHASLDREGNLQYAYVKWDYAPLPFMDRCAFLHRLETAYNRWEDRSRHGRLVAQAIFREINRICRDQNIVPVMADLTWDRKTGEMLEYCRSLGMFPVDISLDFTHPDNNFLPHDGHPNARANREYARRLGDFLQERVLPQMAGTMGK